MSFIFPDELEQVDLADGEWVKLKRLSKGDLVRAQKAMLRGAVIGTDGTVDHMQADSAVEAMEFAQMEIAIREWSARHRDRPVPITAENIRDLLDPDDHATIKAAIERINPVRSDDERKNSNSGSSAPSAPAEAGLGNSDTLPS